MQDEEARRRRQSEVSREGSKTEKRIMQILVEEADIRNRCIIGKGPSHRVNSDSFILKDFQTGELVSLHHSVLSVRYTTEEGEQVYMYMDADIVIYDKLREEVVCVISSKKSFRERGAQSAYWSIKKSDRKFKYILVTPDVDRELFNPAKPDLCGKWRIILENEMDAVFVIDKEPPFRSRDFYVGNEHLKNYIKALLI